MLLKLNIKQSNLSKLCSLSLHLTKLICQKLNYCFFTPKCCNHQVRMKAISCRFKSCQAHQTVIIRTFFLLETGSDLPLFLLIRISTVKNYRLEYLERIYSDTLSISGNKVDLFIDNKSKSLRILSFYVGVVLFGRTFCKEFNTNLLHNILDVRRVLKIMKRDTIYHISVLLYYLFCFFGTDLRLNNPLSPITRFSIPFFVH